jgi:hypothetical protein
MPNLKAEWRKYLIGLVFLASAFLGGGAAPQLWTDTVLQVLIVLAAAPILAAGRGEPVDARVKWLCGLLLASIAVQLLPLPEDLVRQFQSGTLSGGRLEPGAGGVGFISLGLGRTLEALLYVAVLVVLLLALLRLPGPQLHALLPFLLAGIACNALAGFVQYSASSAVRTDGLLPFTITAGFFANRNHFVSLLCVSLPFLLYLATFRGMRPWSVASMVLLLLVLLATGSRPHRAGRAGGVGGAFRLPLAGRRHRPGGRGCAARRLRHGNLAAVREARLRRRVARAVCRDHA